MICIVALIVFAFLGIFSARYRSLAAEAFDCVFRKATFRKCRTDLDERIKSRVSAKLLVHSPKTAKFVFKNFTLLSYIFVILTILSLVLTMNGAYNYIKFGNCNGADSQEFCIINKISGSEAVEGCKVPECNVTECGCEDSDSCEGECEGCLASTEEDADA